MVGLVDEDEFVGIEQGPEEVLVAFEFFVAVFAEGFLHFAQFDFRGFAAECSEVEVGNFLCFVPGGAHFFEQKTATFDGAGFIDEFTVHHHEGLGDGAVECCGFVIFVVFEGDDELLHPAAALFFLG